MEAQVAVSESNVNDVEKVKLLHEKRDAMLAEIAKVIIGQDKIIREMLIALFSGGHCLLVGVPGLAKTSLVRTFARILHLKFQRIQFTPDLLPSDITGTDTESDSSSISVVQNVTNWNTEFWATYRVYSFDDTKADYEDGKALFVGARFKF